MKPRESQIPASRWLVAWNGGLWLVAVVFLVGFLVACWLPYLGWKERAEQAGHAVEVSR